MNGHVVLGMVRDIDENPITFSSVNSWTRKHSIHGDNRFCMAQSTNILHFNLFHIKEHIKQLFKKMYKQKLKPQEYYNLNR